jgi:hypothetical protein
MYHDPDIPFPGRVIFFQKELIPLWLKALARPEADMRRLAAASLADVRRRGMTDLEATVPPLLQALTQPDQHPAVRLAAAQDLIALDAREAAAEPLFQLARSGDSDLRNVIEPALARWDYAPIRAVWLERLSAVGMPRQSHLLALRGLGQVRESRAVPRLRELALAPATDPLLRREAARSLGLIQTRGLEQDAERLLAEKGPTAMLARLAAAALLRYHRGDRAIELLKRLAQYAEPAVGNVAVEALYEADPCLVVALARPLSASPDANVRGHVVEALRKCPGPEYVSLLTDLTDDVHPDVRTAARHALREWSRRPGYDGPVRRELTRMLATSHWRGLEQAIILLAQLDHKAAAPRFVELLRFDRPEVFVAAAWGLRRLAVPDTLSAMQQTIEWQLQQVPRAGSVARLMAMDWQVAFLAQALGQARYRPADALLRRFIPRNVGQPGGESRAAAAWALGYIHEGKGPPELVQALIGRMKELRAMPPEDGRIGEMSAVALGRMKARAAVDTLKSFSPGVVTEYAVANKSAWALQQITGAPLRPGQPAPLTQRGWFLEPIIKGR